MKDGSGLLADTYAKHVVKGARLRARLRLRDYHCGPLTGSIHCINWRRC